MLLHLILTLLIVQVYMVSIYDVTIPMSELDSKIIKLMVNPQLDNGDDLFKHSYNYFNRLDDIDILLNKQRKQHIGMKMYLEVKEAGGPQFVNTTFDIDGFKNAYDWRDEEINEFKAIIKGTIRLWKKLQLIVDDIHKKQNAKKTNIKNN